MKDKKYLLGVYDTKISVFDIESRRLNTVYKVNMIVSKDVIDWLEMHDTIITSEGDRLYKCNEVMYINLGSVDITPQ